MVVKKRNSCICGVEGVWASGRARGGWNDANVRAKMKLSSVL